MKKSRNRTNKQIDLFVEILVDAEYGFAVCLERKALKTGAHLGFSKGRGPNSRKRANQYKTKKNQIYHISVMSF